MRKGAFYNGFAGCVPAKFTASLEGVTAVLTAADVAAAYEAARPVLKRAADEDAKYEAANCGKAKRDTKAEI